MPLKAFLLIISLLTISFSFSQTKNERLGDKAFEMNKHYTALFYYEKAIEDSTDRFDTWFKAGNSSEILKDYSKAKEYYKKAQYKLQPPDTSIPERSAQLFYSLGTIHKYLGEYNEAELFFSKVLNTNSKGPKSVGLYDKCVQEMKSSKWAQENLTSKNHISITQLPEPLNDINSDFSAGLFKDHLLQVTSLKPVEEILEGTVEENFSSIYFYDNAFNPVDFSFEWDEEKIQNKHIANGYYLKERSIFFFTLCEDISETEKKCDIYVSIFKNNKWFNPRKLNINKLTESSTHPTAFVDNNGKINLYFSSERKTGLGESDIYYAVEKENLIFEEEQLLPEPINSAGSETTPYFNPKENRLYFSSNWHYGYGGFDIFYSELKNNNWQEPINMGLPVNSSSEDQYFRFINDTDGFLSSNREGAHTYMGTSCCYDVFGFEMPKIIIDTPRIVKKEKEKPKKEDKVKKKQLQTMLPVTVYFHNDEPNPKTTDTTTLLSYSDCYNDYKNVELDYYKINKEDRLKTFFSEDVDGGYANIRIFTSILGDLLETKQAELLIQGYCSPLALNDYNINLSKRRNASIVNFLKEELSENAFKNLAITFVPHGEEKAKKIG